MRIEPVFVFDLDGTLVDSVYQHVFAWGEALEAERISLSFWRIHRKVGMSGGLLANQLLRETGVEISAAVVERLKQRHATAYMARAGTIRPLPARSNSCHGYRKPRSLPSLLSGSISTRHPS